MEARTAKLANMADTSAASNETPTPIHSTLSMTLNDNTRARWLGGCEPRHNPCNDPPTRVLSSVNIVREIDLHVPLQA